MLENFFTCSICGGETATRNRAKTLFCNACGYCVSRAGHVVRTPMHPDYEKLGHRIYRSDDDAMKMPASQAAKAPRVRRPGARRR